MNWINNLPTTIATILEVLGVLALVAAGGGAILKFLSPFKKIKERVDKHDTLLQKDNQRIQREEEATAILLSSQFALINHALTGNSQEALRAARDKLQDYLSKR